MSPYMFSLIFHKGLERLNLSGNNFQNFGYLANLFPWNAFPLMPNLTTLVLQHCSIEDMHNKVLDTLPGLTHLDLRRNNVKSLFHGLLLPTLEYLDLSYQCINQDCDNPDFNFQSGFSDFDMSRLEVLKMSGLHFENITSKIFVNLPSLKTLELDHSYLKSINDYAFQGATNLRILNLSRIPDLEDLPKHVFDGLDQLEVLDLSYCPKAFRKKPKSDGQHFKFTLQNLRVLNLTCALLEEGSDCTTRYDHASHLDPDLLKLVPNLETIDLSENSLAPWQGDLYENSTKLKTIKLQKNNLISLTDGMLKTFQRLKHLDLRDNAFICDSRNNYVPRFYQISLDHPDLRIAGWMDGDGYKCNNGSRHVTFKEYAIWWDDSHITTTTTSSQPEVRSTKYIISFIVGAVCAMTLSVVLTTYTYQNRFFLGYYFIKHRKRLRERLRKTDDPEIDILSNYEYDVFVSYSNEETGWVNEKLLPMLGIFKYYMAKVTKNEGDNFQNHVV